MADTFTVIADLRKRVGELENRVAYYEGKGESWVENALGVVGHRFNPEGVCIRCGTDAEDADQDCVEGIIRDNLQKEAIIAALEKSARILAAQFGLVLETDIIGAFTQKLIAEGHPDFVDPSAPYRWIEDEGEPKDRSLKLIKNQYSGWEKAWYENGQWYGASRRNGVFNWWALPPTPKENPQGWRPAITKDHNTDLVLAFADRDISPEFAENGDSGIFIARFDGQHWCGANYERKTDYVIRPVTHWMELPNSDHSL